jgi:phage terminase large subunit-like protein
VDLDAIEALWAAGSAGPPPPALSMAHAAKDALRPREARPWRRTARPEQIAVAESTAPYTLLLAGRGFGKTFTAANTLVEWALREPGYYAIVAPTFSDCRALCVEGPSGILRALGAPTGDPAGDLRRYDKSKFEIHLTNGSTFIMASDEAPARLRGPNFSGAWCVAQGEPVVTARGRVPIEQVRVGDRVATRHGWRRVTAATRTKRDAPTLRIVTEAGSLRVTGDHPVWIEGCGWTRADSVLPSATMLTWNTAESMANRSTVHPLGKSGAANGGTGSSLATTRTALVSCCTGPSGRPSMAVSPTVTTFTTTTRTRRTTGWATCDCSPSLSTAPSTCATAIRSSSIRPAKPLASGPRGCGLDASRAMSPAQGPAATWCSSPRGCALGSTAPPVGRRSTVLRVEPSTSSDVYDLTVEGAHEFFAGDGALLIHNCDEIGSYKRIKETWEEGVEFSTRIGSARKILTGTPKRGNPLVKEFHDKGVRGDPTVLLVRGRTLDNAANLSGTFLDTIRSKYEGTTLGRQELDGELLPDAEGAIVTTALIDATRCQWADVPEFDRIMVGVDPAVTSRESSDHTGIVAVAIGPPPKSSYLGEPARVSGPHLYVLADDSVRATPESWARRVLKVAEMWAADAVTVEVNQGGDLVTTMVRMVADSQGLATPRMVPVRAAVNKRTRAEPVAGVWEQRRIHVVGALPDVEDQWAGWVPGDPDSPDQLDAMVWAAAGLMPQLSINAPTEVRLLASG